MVLGGFRSFHVLVTTTTHFEFGRCWRIHSQHVSITKGFAYLLQISCCSDLERAGCEKGGYYQRCNNNAAHPSLYYTK